MRSSRAMRKTKKPLSGHEALREQAHLVWEDVLQDLPPFRTIAESLGITRQAVMQWYLVPDRWITAIEEMGAGPREKLRPDIPWREKK